MHRIPFKNKSVFLAPMAGVTDSGFRQICKKYGADITVSEMVSAKGMYYNDQKSFALLHHSKSEQPISMQIFGSDIECIKKATEYISKNYTPLSIDINMGCPAPKIFQNGDGCAIMKNPDLAFDIIVAVKNNTDLPVSVKFRSGVDELNINAVEFARTCEKAGADYITVHGRTRSQFYTGKSDPDIIKSVVDNVSIPVIANGDIVDGESAKYILDYTGAHSIMVGRAATGNLLIFNHIKSYLGLCDSYSFETQDIFDVALEHLSYCIKDKGECIAVKEFRKHMLWYLKGINNASKYKQESCHIATYNDCKSIFTKAKKEF